MLERIVRRSRVRLGKSKFTGLPAIFIGVAAVVTAAGVTAAMGKAATALPEMVRETRELLTVLNGGRRPRLGPPG
jgi:hypothetical protein